MHKTVAGISQCCAEPGMLICAASAWTGGFSGTSLNCNTLLWALSPVGKPAPASCSSALVIPGKERSGCSIMSRESSSVDMLLGNTTCSILSSYSEKISFLTTPQVCRVPMSMWSLRSPQLHCLPFFSGTNCTSENACFLNSAPAGAEGIYITIRSSQQR